MSSARTRVPRSSREARRSSDTASLTADVARRIDTSQGGGDALDHRTETQLESRLGHDFSRVRVHADAPADRLTRDLDARAFAFHDHVFFRTGEFAPESPAGLRLLAHEAVHTRQPAGASSPGLATGIDAPDSVLEREARAAEHAVLGPPSSSRVQLSSAAAAQVHLWPWDDDKPREGAAAEPGMLSSIGSMASGAASTAYDGYQKGTDFHALGGALNSGVDLAEKASADGNQKMVDESKGHWYEGLAKGAAWWNNTTTQVTGGVVKGVGDLGFGLAGGLAHPIDAAVGKDGNGGLLSIAEHDLPFAGSVLKGAHGLVDLGLGAAGVHYKGQGQYGNSFGELGNHLFNPMQQMRDDQEFNGNLAQGIVDPDKKGLQGFKDKPAESIARAVTNIAPIALGVGEAAGAGEAGVARPPVAVEPAPPTLRSPVLPEGVPAPKPFEPNIRVVDPTIVDPNAPTVRAPSLPPDVIPGPDTQLSPGNTPPSTVRPPVPTTPGLGPVEVTPNTPGPARTPTTPGLGPQDPGTLPGPISELDPALRDPALQGPITADSEALRNRPDSNGPLSDIGPISPRQPPPTPSVDELLKGLENRGLESPRIPFPDSSPSISELLRGLGGDR